MRYIVGYTANERGRDALNLAAVLARSQDAELDLVMVDPVHSPYTAVYPPESGYRDLLEEQLEQWLSEGLSLVPEDVPAAGYIRNADSDAAGLINAAAELKAGLIVVGAASNGIFKRYTVGSVANALLHAAPVPVALAPHGYSRTGALTRITCAVGNRRGSEDVLETAVQTAARSGLPLRLVSLVALDSPSGDEKAVLEAGLHAQDRLARAQELAAGRCPVTAVVASGRTIDTEELCMMTSRSPRYYVSAAYWDRDSLLWAFPAIVEADGNYARELLLSIFQRQGRNFGIHSRYIDGTVLEPALNWMNCAPRRLPWNATLPSPAIRAFCKRKSSGRGWRALWKN